VPSRAFSARRASVQPFAQRAALAAFSRMVIASNHYLVTGLPIAKPDDQEAQRLGLRLDLPPRPGGPRWWRRLWAAVAVSSAVRMGLIGYYEDLRPVLECYAPAADQVFFPSPHIFRARTEPAEYGQLSMTFTEAGVARASATASQILRHPPAIPIVPRPPLIIPVLANLKNLALPIASYASRITAERY
jgi:hypothetical protein